MKTRYIIAILLTVLGISSCDTYVVGGKTSLIFYPRVCEEIMTHPMQYIERSQEFAGKTYTNRVIKYLDGSEVEAEQFILQMETGSKGLKVLKIRQPNDERVREYLALADKNLAPKDPALGRQLTRDYNNRPGERQRSYKSREPIIGMPPPLHWEYRVTGVKDFRIISLSPLFGLPAETSLNDYFSIYEFKPRQIISSRTKTLLWGYSDKGEITRIGQWLAMSPMAPPIVLFRLKSRPQELPIKTKFVTILETTAGTTLRDTLEVQLK